MKSKKLKAVCLLGTLKKSPKKSNTEQIVKEIFKKLKREGVETKIIRLADYNIKHGLKTKMGDDWPKILNHIIESEIVIFATPIWWGQYSSHIQKIIERMDGLDEDYIATGRQVLKNKVAGIVITGAEDGAQHITGILAGTLMWFGFCLPPASSVYWVGEVGVPPKKNEIKNSRAVKEMVESSSKGLYNYAKMISENKKLLNEKKP